ncbi:hypothetical protein PV05_04932 [Exophiala xenobiotica]|uniref:Transcription factor domain-containing protein n=1 Tax=Exophiala xenobiotica TaxID=348802 RepID=A0A0D2F886_9EURO|nr:uncharacterized protein PV05_04932 [Exophiala xenobiotica]KIW56259.1 hypothetical protein PV05_04932 [Exophiala xenobiotica]
MATHQLSRFWTHTVLSAAHNEPAILHAMLALCGTHRAYCENRSAVANAVSTPFTTAAYAHYDKAVRCLWERIARTGFEELQVVLIVCLVLLTFDLIEGRYGEALIHLNHGRQILRQLHSSKVSGKDTTSLVLPQKAQSTLDEISYSFALMDIQSVYFGSQKPEFKLANSPGADETVGFNIPPYFSTFDDAWHSMLLLTNEVYHFGSTIRKPEIAYSSYDPMLGFWQGRLLATLRQWREAFDSSPFRTATSSSATSSNSAASARHTSLRLSHAYLTILVCTGLKLGDEMAYDPLLPQFSTVVALCEQLVSTLPSISLDAGVIPALFITCCFCRHPDLRRRAIRVLSRTGKEGHWDGKQIEMVSREKMILEEEDAGYIYDAEHPVPEDADLAEIIPREARWSESWVFFVSEDYTTVQLAFKRRKRTADGRVIPGDDGYEVKTKLVKIA